MDLIQDLDLILPLLKQVKQRDDLAYQVCVTDWLVQASPRVKNSLHSLGIEYKVLSRQGIRLGLQPRLRGIQAIITAAESTAGPHICAHSITKRANRSGIYTYTLQHGFENVGLNYFDEVEFPEPIYFASQKILLWGDTNLLPPEAPSSTVNRCVAVGCAKEIIPQAPEITIPGKRDYLVAVFENLHWCRYNDNYRQRFLDDLEATASNFPDTTFLVKPHHAGQWLTHRYQGKLPKASNLVIADPKLPQWEAYTAAALIRYADGVITTPSTVAVDTARANCPVAVISYGLDLANYNPLPMLNSGLDWTDFITQLHNDEGKAAAQQLVRNFVNRVLIPGDAAQRIFNLMAADIYQVTPISSNQVTHLFSASPRQLLAANLNKNGITPQVDEENGELPYQVKESLDLLQQIPWEYHFRGKGKRRLVNRLAKERNIYLGNLLSREQKTKLIDLIILVDKQPNPDLESTLGFWQLQSCPLINCWLVPQGANSVATLNQWLEEHQVAENVQVWGDDSQQWAQLQQNSDYIIFARPGDILAPTLAHMLKLKAIEGQSDVVVWNLQHLGEKTPAGWRVKAWLRRPQLELHTLAHVNYIGTSFAVKPHLAAAYSQDLFQQILPNNAHLFQLWLAGRKEVKWYTQPEFYTLRALINQPASAQKLVTPFQEQYEEYFHSLQGQFSYRWRNDEQQPYQLQPRRQAQSISVIIPGCNQLDAVCRCLSALQQQSVSSQWEVVLVHTSKLEQIKDFWQQNQLASQFKLLSAKKSDSYTQKLNLGIAASTGEVIFCLHPEVELASTSALEEMAAWALLPQIGTVGCRIVAADGALVSAGMQAVSSGGVEVCQDSTYAQVIRETFANGWHCFAMSRDSYAKVGEFDALNFPDEYGDTEFCLRLRKAGYTHMYLGHLQGSFLPINAPEGCDTLSQQLILRQRFPETALAGLFQLTRDEDLLGEDTVFRIQEMSPNIKELVKVALKKSGVYDLIKHNPQIKEFAKSVYHRVSKFLA